jgi:thymidylate kinase
VCVKKVNELALKSDPFLTVTGILVSLQVAFSNYINVKKTMKERKSHYLVISDNYSLSLATYRIICSRSWSSSFGFDVRGNQILRLR